MSEALVERLNAAEIALRDDRPYAAVAIGEAADRIEALEREVKELRETAWKAEKYDSVVKALEVCDGGRYRNDTIESCIQALQRRDTAEADKARLSEALREARTSLENYGDRDGYADEDGHVPENDEGTLARETIKQIDAALSGSGSGWRLVPYLWQCKDYADGWLSFANEDEAQAYQRDTGCAVRITYRPLPAAPQQGGE